MALKPDSAPEHAPHLRPGAAADRVGTNSCVDVPQRLVVGLYIGMTTPTPLPFEPTDTKPRTLLVSIKQASEMLSLSRSSIYLLIESDQLSPIRIGRSVRFTVEQLERFVADRTISQ